MATQSILVESIISVLKNIIARVLVHVSVRLIEWSATQGVDSDVLLLEVVPQVHSSCFPLITELEEEGDDCMWRNRDTDVL